MCQFIILQAYKYTIYHISGGTHSEVVICHFYRTAHSCLNWMHISLHFHLRWKIKTVINKFHFDILSILTTCRILLFRVFSFMLNSHKQQFLTYFHLTSLACLLAVCPNEWVLWWKILAVQVMVRMAELFYFSHENLYRSGFIWMRLHHGRIRCLPHIHRT